MTRKKALITGVTGQDGAYLADFLIQMGYEVFGCYRRLSTPNFWRLLYLGILDKITLLPIDIADTTSLMQAIAHSQPDEIYNLAAQSFVSASFDSPVATGNITGLGTARILEAVRQLNPRTKFYQASTSELYGIYGSRAKEALTEEGPFIPASPYAAAKLYAYHMTRSYREAYNIFACNGILFNHESPLRGLDFVTRKISNSVAQIALGLKDELALGNIHPKRDWGFAPEYVQSMWLMMQHDTPDDYVVATNESHSVEEFVKDAFSVVDLDWRNYVKIHDSLYRPLEVNCLCGNYSKAKRILGWEPKARFEQLVEIMVLADLERWTRSLKGERFPWDAINTLDGCSTNSHQHEIKKSNSRTPHDIATSMHRKVSNYLTR